MGKKAGFALIGVGGFIVLTAILMAAGGMEVAFKIAIPIGIHMVPLNEELRAWLDVPLTMGLKATLSKVEAFSEEGYIGAGKLDFIATLAGESGDEAGEPVVPVIFVQEEAAIDEVQRYVLQAGPLNYPSIFFWILALASLGALIVSIVFRLKKPNKDGMADPGIEMSAANVVNVLPLDAEMKE